MVLFFNFLLIESELYSAIFLIIQMHEIKAVTSILFFDNDNNASTNNHSHLL